MSRPLIFVILFFQFLPSNRSLHCSSVRFGHRKELASIQSRLSIVWFIPFNLIHVFVEEVRLWSIASSVLYPLEIHRSSTYYTPWFDRKCNFYRLMCPPSTCVSKYTVQYFATLLDIFLFWSKNVLGNYWIATILLRPLFCCLFIFIFIFWKFITIP